MENLIGNVVLKSFYKKRNGKINKPRSAESF